MGTSCLSKPRTPDATAAQKAASFAQDINHSAEKKKGRSKESVPATGGNQRVNLHIRSDSVDDEAADDVGQEAGSVTAEGGSSNILLELFTSQGCSGCPAADEILSELMHGDDDDFGQVTTLAYHVTIWDYAGHVDPFSDSQWDVRQKLYSQGLEPIRGVYTPQLVVNGTAHVGGGNKINVYRSLDAEAKRLRRQAKQSGGEGQTTAMQLSVRRVKEGVLHLRVETTQAVEPEEEYALYAALYEHGCITKVKKGENKGRTLRNDSVVRSLKQVGIVSGEVAHSNTATHSCKAKLRVPPGASSRLGVAVWLQNTQTLAIHGVVKADL